MNDATYERVCAEVLLRLDDWKPAREVGSVGQLRSLVASGLVQFSPDYYTYDTRTAHNHPGVYRRTKAGDRAALLLRASAPTPQEGGSE